MTAKKSIMDTALNKENHTGCRPPLLHWQSTACRMNGGNAEKEPYQRPEIRDIPSVSPGIVLCGQEISAAPPDDDYPDL